MPALNKVQFPWRLLVVVEFAFVTWLISSRDIPPLWKKVAALPPLIASAPILFVALPAGHPTLTELDRQRPEVLEYLPAGTRFDTIDDVLEFARKLPAERVSGQVKTVRRFYFPHWVVQCGGKPVRTFPDKDTGLLSFPSHPRCEIEARMLPSERAGLIISLLAAIGLISLIIIRARRRSIAPQ